MYDHAGVDRRQLMQRTLLLVGATMLPVGTDAFAAVAKGAKRVLSPAQLKAFTAIADTLIPATDTPGAVAVGVPRLFDGLLANWASAKRKEDLIGAIAEIDAFAMERDKKRFAALASGRRKALLIEYDKAALKPGPPRTEKLGAFAAMMAGPPIMKPAYVKMKELVINLYYSTEVAMTQELIYEHVPGAYVPSLNVTPETRPFAGVGGLF